MSLQSPSAVTFLRAAVAVLRRRAGAYRLLRRPSDLLPLTLLAVIVLSAVLAPLTASHDPNEIDPVNGLLGPSLEHWFGTDQLGRDLFSRALYGARNSFRIAAIATLVALALGVLWGGVAAVHGGWVDEALMRMAEAIMAIPLLLFALIFVAAFGASKESLPLIIGILHVPPTARMARAAVLSELTSDYCVAARAYGASRWRILFSEVFPNAQPMLVVQAAYVAAHAVLVEASLSFLGLGIQPPEPSLGLLLLEGYYNIHSSQSYIVFPGVIIFATVLTLNTLGDNLEAVLKVKVDANFGASQSFGRASVTFAADRIATDPNVRVPPARATSPNADSDVLLDVRNLEVAFPSDSGWFHPVRKVSFGVRRGQRVAIIGESGAGKSLTALALMRLVRPPGGISDGEVFLNGRDLLRLDEREMAQARGAEIAIVYQNPLSVLNPIQRVGDQIVEAIRTHEGVARRAARSRAIDLLHQVGVPEPKRRIDDYPHQFSGGMRQRVMIAIAVSANPHLLIADEPTTALDVTTQAKILDLLARLAEERNMALLLITHDLGVAARICTNMLVMHAGRIVEAASAAELYTRPTHPYTEALLGSTVRMDVDVSKTIPAIPGQPPLPWQLPSGCSFHPRCPYAVDLCRTTVPPPIYLDGPGESVAECHFASERFHSTHSGRTGERVDVNP